MPREVLVARLRDLRRECEQWAKEYSRFIDRVVSLYTQAERDLKLLRLEPQEAKQAEFVLEGVLLVALRKAGDLELHVRAAA